MKCVANNNYSRRSSQNSNSAQCVRINCFRFVIMGDITKHLQNIVIGGLRIDYDISPDVS